MKFKNLKSGIKFKNFKGIKLKSKNFKIGSISTLITIIVVASVIILNLIVGVLSEKFQFKFDLTSEKRFEISPESSKYLSNLKKEINISILADSNDFASKDPVTLQIDEILKQYKNLSSNIKINFIDIEKNPNFASKYQREKLNPFDIIVSNNENYHLIKFTDLFDMQKKVDGSNTVASYKTEQEITSAILNISEDNKPKILILEGYEEEESEGFENLLKKNGYDVQRTAISNSEIPNDIRAVIVMAPNRDYMPESIEKLENFLKNNPSKSLIYAANPKTKSLKNLENLIEKYGAKIEDGIIFEKNNKYLLSNQDPFSFLSSYAGTTYTKDMKSTKVPIYISHSKAITIKNKDKVEAMTQSSTESGVRPNDSSNDWKISSEKLTGPIPTSACLKIGEKDQNDPDKKQSNIVVFGSNFVFDDNVLSSTKVNNSDYLLNIFKILTGNESSKVSIKPKNPENKELGITARDSNILFFIFVLLIPGLILGTCLIVLSKRKNY